MQLSSEIDTWVSQSFDAFIDCASGSKKTTLLRDIAIDSQYRQENIIESMFLDSLKRDSFQDVVVIRQYTKTYNDERKVHDIVGKYASEVVTVVEVKTPFTDSGGLRFHTGNNGTLTKDANALLAALGDGVISTYELITIFECYPVDSSGNVVILKKG